MKSLTAAQQRLLDQVKAEGEVTLNGHGLRTARVLHDRRRAVLDFETSTLRPCCASMSHQYLVPATERVTYTYRGSDEPDTELACRTCAETYSRMPVLRNLKREPAARVVQS